MELPYFYAADLLTGSKAVLLDETNSKHAVQVLRMKNGDRLQLTNGKGLLATAEIADAHKKTTSVHILLEDIQVARAKRRSAIAISPVKNAGRFEWFLEKATELGIAEIFPLVCHRTEREHFRFDRMNAICISAMLQSQQTWLPVLHHPIAFNVLVANNSYQNKWIAHCEEQEKNPLTGVLRTAMGDSLVLIGPEGDFTPDEIYTAITAGFKPVALGDTRLRTETAGVVAATLLQLL